VFLVIPGLPLAIVIAAYLPSGPLTLGLVLTVTGWAWNARVLRAQTLAQRRRDFVAAAVVAGESEWRIITREILPTMTSLLVAQVIGSTVYAIGAQVGLEFLGLGNVSAVNLGHEPLLGAERLGAAHRGVVDLRAHRASASRSSASASPCSTRASTRSPIRGSRSSAPGEPSSPRAAKSRRGSTPVVAGDV